MPDLPAADDLSRHRDALERIIGGEPLAVVLDAQCRDIERRLGPASRCSVLVCDDTGTRLLHAAGPTLDATLAARVDGLPIGERQGACGAAAARRAPVVVADIRTDPLTAAFTWIADDFGLHAVWSHPVTGPDGRLLGTFAVYRTVPGAPDDQERDLVASAALLTALAIERQRTTGALAHAAVTDRLTGLANRDGLAAQLAANAGRPTALALIDLDGFKWVNDSLGHLAGDEVLAEVAERLLHHLDGIGRVARFGGDEFTVVVDGPVASTPAVVAAAVADAFVAPFAPAGRHVRLTASVGIATTTAPDDLGPTGLIARADAAMFMAKAAGGAQHRVYDTVVGARLAHRVATESDLRRAIDGDQIAVSFQPVLDLRTGRWRAVEALARWRHPTTGPISPEEFVGLAEDIGLIVPLGHRVLDLAVAAAVAPGVADGGVAVAVNASITQLTDPRFAEDLGERLADARLDPSRLVLEVTETLLMTELERVRGTLEHLAGIGVPVLIDDFGTGFSSIARLRDLPVRGVKIDRELVRDVGRDRDADRVLEAVLNLARAFGLATVAEGVERPGVVDQLADMGCDHAQGYAIGRPVGAARLAAVLAAPPPPVRRASVLEHGTGG